MLVEVASRRFAIPQECPCCGAAPDAELPIHLTRSPERPVASESARELVFPYCRRCVEHVALWETSGPAPAIALGGIVAGVGAGIAVHPVAGVVAFVAAIVAAGLSRRARRAKARAAMRESCADPGRAVVYLGWSGHTSGFELPSHAYAAKLAEQNADVLASPSPQLARLLEGYKAARLAVPTPAAPVHAVPPPASAADWIARLQGAGGVVERRELVRRALDALAEPIDRQAVLAIAVRLELAPILDELQGMSNIAAKGRLGKAIEAVRADNMPEALQSAVLRDLDAHWRRL